MVEYVHDYDKEYAIHRPKSVPVIDDARNVDYRKLLATLESRDLDYLQIDLEVNNRSTLDTLELLDKTVFDDHRFATVTFEHDIYTGDFFNTRKASREIFKKRGYVLLFPDVQVFWLGGWNPNEDWYVHPDLVDSAFIEKVKTNKSLRHPEIIDRLSNKEAEYQNYEQ
jgi:hypothetical protein